MSKSREEIDTIIAKYMKYNFMRYCDGGMRVKPIGMIGNVTRKCYTESMDALLTVIHKTKRESFHVSTEVYGKINGWSHNGDYNVLPLAREIADIIETWIEGGE